MGEKPFNRKLRKETIADKAFNQPYIPEEDVFSPGSDAPLAIPSPAKTRTDVLAEYKMQENMLKRLSRTQSSQDLHLFGVEPLGARETFKAGSEVTYTHRLFPRTFFVYEVGKFISSAGAPNYLLEFKRVTNY
ncbi:MAG: hypothetical protein V1648_03580 [Candidatus Aenigmatarchaeota archaeon]